MIGLQKQVRRVILPGRRSSWPRLECLTGCLKWPKSQKLYKSAPVGCGVIKECLTRVSQNSASQDCPSRVLHNCPTVLI
jgi:hypothetical protein